MKLVYICSPYAEDVERISGLPEPPAAMLRSRLRACCRPPAVPADFRRFCPSQREAGIRMGLRVLASCEELWICGERVSHGMSREIVEAKRLGIPIRSISTEQIQGGIHMSGNGIWARRAPPRSAAPRKHG